MSFTASAAPSGSVDTTNVSTTKNRPRLMISQMELENFKSYAGLQRIGPFHKSFSSIVGPNGSGKSNVIDALLFVFGKRATQMRLKKVSELIHRSSSFPNLEFARVSVSFQIIIDDAHDSEGYEVVENSEFIITRVAYSNNQSKYMINNKNSSFAEIATLLKSHAIDLEHNRFLILQGEVEQIAMMRPKGSSEGEVGLLEYLEEIIGSNVFVEQIEETAKELEVVNEQRAEKVHRLKVAERERDNLSDAKCEAELFLEKERAIRKQKNLLYQVYESVARENGQTLDGKLSSANEKLAAARAKLAESESQISSLRSQYESAKKEHDAISKELASCTTQYAAFERRDVKLQEDLKHIKSNLKKQDTIIDKESKKDKESEEEREKLVVQITKYTTTLQEFEERKKDEENELQKIMEGLQGETQVLRQELEAVQKRQGVEEDKVSALLSEKDLVAERLSLIKARAQRAQTEKDRCEEKLASIAREEETLTQTLATQRRETERETATLASEREKLVKLTENVSRSETALRELRREVESERVVAQTSLSGQRENAAVRAVLAAHREKKGALANCGIIGRLGELASIPSRLDVALSTACRSLDSVLVRETSDAQAAVQFLRAQNLGRVTFVIASQINPVWLPKSRAAIALPSGCERLFDCVENIGRDCETESDRESVRAALYFSLRDTLVAPDLDSAVKVAFGGDRERGRGESRWRVVTVDGQLVETSGAMCGGGTQQRRGAMTLSENIREKKRSSHAQSDKSERDAELRLKALEREIGEKEQELGALRQAREQCENEIERLTKSLREREREIQRITHTLTRHQETKSSTSTRLNALRKETDLTPEEVRESEAVAARLAEIERDVERASPELADLRKESARLQRQVLSVGGMKLQKAQAKVDSLQAQVESLSLSLSHKQVELSQCDKAREKTRLALQKATDEKQKLTERSQALIAEQKSMEDEALAVIEALEAAKQQRDLLQQRLEERSAEFDAIQRDTEKSKKAELDLLADQERVQKERQKERDSETHWHKQGEEVRAQHRDEEREWRRVVRETTEEVLRANRKEEEKQNENAMDVEESSEDAADAEDELLVQSEEVLKGLRADELQRDLHVLEGERNKLKSNINMNALLDYLRKDASYKLRLHDLEAMNARRGEVKARHEALRRERLTLFMSGFGAISLKLKEMYQMITLGGDAELELLDSLDPFSEGISFSVRPPKKSWKAIANLSGGEKTLSSLSLVFALHAFKPTPLYVMDEIDAALDFKNVSIVANYIKERTRDAQFVVISLRNNMFELADRLVGIYKTHDATKSVTINPTLFNAATAKSESSAESAPRQPLQDATNRLA